MKVNNSTKYYAFVTTNANGDRNMFTYEKTNGMMTAKMYANFLLTDELQNIVGVSYKRIA